MLLLIDNYDSFTYNLVQYFGELGEEVQVYRNDQISLKEIERLNPQYLVISPGPCTPDKAGISIEVIKTFADKIPILGVCLGFQSIVQAFGGVITHAKEIMHGKVSMIHHSESGVFKGLTNPLQATRYHSLAVEQISLPTCLSITAWTKKNDKNDEIMAIRHNELAIEGVQFHPESILTQYGHEMLKNFLTEYAS